MSLTEQERRIRIARRAAKELVPDSVVNLGIGIPVLVADYVAPGVVVHLHSENGVLGAGPFPTPEEADPDLANAAKQAITVLPGASFFGSAESFAMIRGGHVDVAVLGSLQVDENGNLANWALPGQAVLGVGGAMDLASGARRVIALMSHTAKGGTPKFVAKCTLPLTAEGVVDTLITDLAVFRRRGSQFELIDLAPDTTLAEVAAATSARYSVNREAIDAHQGTWG